MGEAAEVVEAEVVEAEVVEAKPVGLNTCNINPWTFSLTPDQRLDAEWSKKVINHKSLNTTHTTARLLRKPTSGVKPPMSSVQQQEMHGQQQGPGGWYIGTQPVQNVAFVAVPEEQPSKQSMEKHGFKEKTKGLLAKLRKGKVCT